MVHNDGTMDVLVDGKLERRKATMVMPSPLGMMAGCVPFPHCEPDVSENEAAYWIIGSDVPNIIKVKA